MCHAKQRVLLYLKLVGWSDTIYNYVYILLTNSLEVKAAMAKLKTPDFYYVITEKYPILPSRRNIIKGSELNFYKIMHTQIQEIKIHFPPSINSTAIIKSQGVFLILEAARDAQISTHEV